MTTRIISSPTDYMAERISSTQLRLTGLPVPISLPMILGIVEYETLPGPCLRKYTPTNHAFLWDGETLTVSGATFAETSKFEVTIQVPENLYTSEKTSIAFCPFCKSDRLGYVPRFSYTDDYDSLIIFVHGHIKCFSCEAQGPGASNEAEAWELWNNLLEDAAAVVHSLGQEPELTMECATLDLSIKVGDQLKIVSDPTDPTKAFVERAGPGDSVIGVAIRAPCLDHVLVRYYHD